MSATMDGHAEDDGHVYQSTGDNTSMSIIIITGPKEP
jgi:hypothetical protein